MKKIFKDINPGIIRLLIVGTIPAAWWIGTTLAKIDQNFRPVEDVYKYALVFGTPMYWICILIGLWIYRGFKQNE